MRTPARGLREYAVTCYSDMSVMFICVVFELPQAFLRAFVKPAHWDSLTFTLQPVLERKMGVKYIWGEVGS